MKIATSKFNYAFVMIISMATLLVAMAFKVKPANEAKLSITFSHYAGGRPLLLDSVSYTNALGQAYSISMFKYYIGKIHLKKTDGAEVQLPDYYLVNEDEETSKSFVLTSLPVGQYSGISFLIGVDSADNCGGAQAGALDPVNAMFWAWNTGYIFLKMEGRSPASKSPGHIYEFHIGGYKAPADCIRRISLAFGKTLSLDAGGHHEVLIQTDAAELLKAPVAIDFAKLSSVTDYHNATMVADNYVDMFSIRSVQ